MPMSRTWPRKFVPKMASRSRSSYQDFLSFWKDGEPDEYNAATLGGKVESG